MFKGRSVFLLDIISNSLGAVLLLFLVLISRHFEPPPERLSETLLILAEADLPESEIGLWLQPPSSDDRVFFNEEIDGLVWNEAGGLYRRPRTSAGAVDADSARFLRSARSAGPAAGHARTAAGALIPQPATGCWRFGAFYEDNAALLRPAPLEAKVEIRVWFEGPLQPAGAPGAGRPEIFTAPAREATHCVRVGRTGAVPEQCCADMSGG